MANTIKLTPSQVTHPMHFPQISSDSCNISLPAQPAFIVSIYISKEGGTWSTAKN